jgi:FdrA protein
VTDVLEVRAGAYYDSVSLMQVSRAVGSAEGVTAALIAMATELNLDLLAGMGFDRPEAGPNDLLIAVRADDDAGAQAARSVLDRELAGLSAHGGSATGLGAAPPARTIGSAAKRIDATVAVISVPGRYAFAEAMDALEAGLSVMLFSDNVPVEQEVRLKEEGTRRDLLVMGPDCGTAIVGGAGLGFANAVRPGPVGIVAASGTGAQEMCCLLDAVDVGVSHVLGVGGRDLSAEVGGRSTLQALAALDADPATELIVVISKPPAEEVAARVRAAAARLSKPVHFALLDAHQAFAPHSQNLSTAAATVAAQVTGSADLAPAWPRWPAAVKQSPRRSALRGLFSGGTLCTEAVLIASKALLEPIESNAGPRIEPQFASNRPSHSMIDFGADEFTEGRPHPMIDFSLRCERLVAEGADPSVGVVLLDVVLGHGAHPDPASELVPAIRGARDKATAGGRDLAVVVSLCGTRDDPQGLDRQASALQGAGAAVFLSNADAADYAAGLVQPGPREQGE